MRGASLLTAFLALPLSAQGDQPVRQHARRVEGLAGLENVAEVATGIFRGALPKEEGLRTLKARGIKTIVNLRHYHGASEERTCGAIGLDYVHIPLSSSRAPHDPDVRRFLRIVTDPRRQPVYFHCWRGKDRTGAMCAVYRVAVQRWSAEEALAEMDAFGPFQAFVALRSYVRRVAQDPSIVYSSSTPPLPMSPIRSTPAPRATSKAATTEP
jgi:protein tyrosine/serine phosphatase